MQDAFHLYVISFAVGAESGLAMVSAQDEKSAFQILKNGGSRHCDGYSLVQIRNIGMSTNCHYGLLMESFVNALEAYNAILAAANHFIKGDKGDSIWSNAYIDENMYLHLIEGEFGVNQHLVFEQETGYLRIV